MTISKEGYKPRIIDKEIKLALKTFGAISIEGPKWCGKTWTALSHANSVVYLNNVENNFNDRKKAEMDVALVLDGAQPALIDEWQEVPAIWDGVRYRCDQTPKKGQYILTGSATPVTDQVHHSGAGRIHRIKMHTMSLFESGESTGEVSLGQLFEGKFTRKKVEGLKLAQIAQLIVRGGWPEAVDADDSEEAMMISRSYIDALLAHDISTIDNVNRDSIKMQRILRSLARNEATIVNDATILRDIDMAGEMSRPTLQEYLGVLERLYLIEHQPAYSVNVRSSARVGASDKRRFTDPSLTCAVLGLSPERLMDDINFMGFLFESLCERDLQVYAEANHGRLFHYRDSLGLEVDTIIELADGRYAALEIKLGNNTIDEAAASLLKFQETVTRKPEFLAVVSGLETVAYQREDGVHVLPIGAIRE